MFIANNTYIFENLIIHGKHYLHAELYAYIFIEDSIIAFFQNQIFKMNLLIYTISTFSEQKDFNSFLY